MALKHRHGAGAPTGLTGYRTELYHDDTNDLWYTNTGSDTVLTTTWASLNAIPITAIVPMSVHAVADVTTAGGLKFTAFYAMGQTPGAQGVFRTYLPPGTVRYLRCNAIAAGVGTCTIFVYKNGNITTLGVTTFATNTTYGAEQTDLSLAHAATLVAGDYLEIGITAFTQKVTAFYAEAQYVQS